MSTARARTRYVSPKRSRGSDPAGTPGVQTILGGGAYNVVDRPGHPLTAEVSFTIEEDYHGQGLATRLMAMLTEIARERGIRSFEAEVLASNPAMLGVFRRRGLPMRRRREGGVVFVAMDIPESDAC